MAANDRSERRIALAAVAGAQGICGELRLKLFTDSIDNLKLYDRLYVAGLPRRLIEVRQSGATPIVQFEGIANREAAEALRGELIEIDGAALPPLPEGEYYHADLIGLPCEDRDGRPVGIVVAVENYGAGDLIEIEDESGKRSLIPFKPGVADLGHGRIILDPEYLA
jgi:16S rRNA processing protein RimM